MIDFFLGGVYDDCGCIEAKQLILSKLMKIKSRLALRQVGIYLRNKVFVEMVMLVSLHQNCEFELERNKLEKKVLLEIKKSLRPISMHSTISISSNCLISIRKYWHNLLYIFYRF